MNREKLLKAWLNFWTWVKKNYYYSLPIFIVFLFCLFFWPIFRSSWLLYPNSLRLKIALFRLEELNKKDLAYCHEDCLSSKRVYLDILSKISQEDLEVTRFYLEKCILDEGKNRETRLMLLSFWRDNLGAVSTNLQNYQLKKDSNFLIVSDINKTWSNLESSGYEQELINRFKKSISSEDRLSYLSLLHNSSSVLVKDFLFEVVSSNYSNEVIKKSIFLLSNFEDKNLYYLQDLETINSLLSNEKFPSELKDQLIFLLANYYELFPLAAQIILVNVANNVDYFNLYQRSFAIDILNNYRSEKIALPDLDIDDWNLYFK